MFMDNCNDDLLCGSDLCDRGCENGGFTLFGTGPFFPPFPPFPPIPPRTFSFYSTRGASVISGAMLPFSLYSGTPLPLDTDGVTVPLGNTYVSYSFQGFTENNVQFIQVVPHINGGAIVPGTFKAIRTTSGLHTEVSGTFAFVSDGSTTFSLFAVTDAGVTISDISFDLLIIPAF
jgi:hypothetical protein